MRIRDSYYTEYKWRESRKVSVLFLCRGAAGDFMKGNVFHIQRFSLFDGPGVRTVVFLKGCPLRCIWCHNPEGWNPREQILYSEKFCIGCGICAQACAHGCHSLSRNIHIYDRRHCTSCGACARACPGEALRISGAKMDTAEVMEQVLLDREVYASSGGGMTCLLYTSRCV